MRKTPASIRSTLLLVAGIALLPWGPALGEEPASNAAATPATAAPSAPAAPGTLMLDLLPRRLNRSVCLTGTFSGQAVEMEDWRNPGHEPVPGVFRFGEQVMRPVPLTKPDQTVAAMTLSLTYDDRKADYDWIYNFILMATMADGSLKLFSAGECPWYASPHRFDAGDFYPANSTKLGCGIDCDGGGMGLERIAGTRAMALHFDGDGIGLRMSAGCSGGSYRLGTGPADDKVHFRLEPAKASACKPLVKWLKQY